MSIDVLLDFLGKCAESIFEFFKQHLQDLSITKPNGSEYSHILRVEHNFILDLIILYLRDVHRLNQLNYFQKLFKLICRHLFVDLA